MGKSVVRWGRERGLFKSECEPFLFVRIYKPRSERCGSGGSRLAVELTRSPRGPEGNGHRSSE